MVKSILLLGDLGSGVNLIKNILFTDPNYLAPFDKNLLDKIYLNHDAKRLHKTWLEEELKTRRWVDYFGFDLSDKIPANLSQHFDELKSKTIFVNHSCFFSKSDRRIISSVRNLRIIACIPESDVGLQWQVRAYVEKKGVKNLHNFSFPENIEKEKQQYIDTFGIENYYKFNILNFYEAVKNNRDTIKNFCLKNNYDIFNTEELYKGNYDYLKNITLIDDTQSETIFSRWLKLHWDFKDTNNWEYAYLRLKT